VTVRQWLGALALLLVSTGNATAAQYEEAVRLFERGNYLEAASIAAAEETAPHLALMARSLLTHAIYVADPSRRTAAVQRAEQAARKALSIDPNHVEAHLQLVIVLYQQSRVASPVNAYLQGYASEARSHLDTALRIEPDNPWAHSLLGGWHFEIVRQAGPTLAYLLLEADLAEGHAAFDRALYLMPNSIVMQYEYARTLLLAGPSANRNKAVGALIAALSQTPASHLEKLMSDRAKATLEAVKTGDTHRLKDILDPES
jgi:tetratricopeptide (TPR) repeat protein